MLAKARNYKWKIHKDGNPELSIAHIIELGKNKMEKAHLYITALYIWTRKLKLTQGELCELSSLG